MNAPDILASSPDAPLLALCAEIEQAENQLRTLLAGHATFEAEAAVMPQADALAAEQSARIKALGKMPWPATQEGVRAMARAVLAIAPEGPADPGGGLLWRMARRFAEGVTAGGAST